MKLKRLILMCRCLSLGLLIGSLPLAAHAQNMKVKSFKLLERDLTANTQGTMRKAPQDGSVAALIRVVTTENDFNFDGGAFALVGNAEYKPGEIWIYVPARAQKITISHQKYGVLRDYYFPVPIEAARTYELLLDLGAGKYSTIQTSTPKSAVWIDGDSIGQAPLINQYLLFGKHKLRAVNGRMEGELEIDVVNDGSEKTETYTIPMTDQSIHFGRVTITTEPGADIVFDGQVKGTGTWVTELREGSYSVETRRANCENGYTTFTVKAGQANNVKAYPPIPYKGYLSLYVRPANAELLVNDKVEPLTDKLSLPVGRQTITLRRKGYVNFEKEYDIRRDVTLNDTIKLALVQRFKKNSIYFGASYGIGSFSGINVMAGGTVAGFDLQASFLYGLSTANEVSFYDHTCDSYLGSAKFSVNEIAAKVGYQFSLTPKFAITPQLGYAVQMLSKDETEGSVPSGTWGAACISAGAKFLYSPISHMAFCVAPEYQVAISKSGIYDAIASAGGCSAGGFLCNIGIIVNF